MQVCSDTLVGNQMLRGVSGGQKKRITTGELLVTPHWHCTALTLQCHGMTAAASLLPAAAAAAVLVSTAHC